MAFWVKKARSGGSPGRFRFAAKSAFAFLVRRQKRNGLYDF